MRAICSIPVQLYDEGLTGIYAVGDVIEGEKARLVLERYPQYFVPDAEPKQGRKK
jgi:hypothetical protein